MNIAGNHILFICTGNSCRSQMAEGWARALGDGLLEARSAGMEAHGKDPRAIAVMAEVGVDISGQESTMLTAEALDWADIVVTVCGHADERCPALPSGARKEHWPIDDPVKATDNENDKEIMIRFRSIREEIHRRVAELVKRISAGERQGEKDNMTVKIRKITV